mmetsp:Transcript_9039/g.27052  ORF Transcript_9039/g.27052 Transcript_9039/m.27052 type:complete len:378 (-) Transcript_9039:720-1853(-)
MACCSGNTTFCCGSALKPSDAMDSAVEPLGAQKPRRSLSKSKIVTKCSKNTPPRIQELSIMSGAVSAWPGMPPNGIGMGMPPNDKRRPLMNGAIACARPPTPTAPMSALEPGGWHVVSLRFRVLPSHTSTCLQTDPSGIVLICSSTCSPTAIGPPPALGIGKGKPPPCEPLPNGPIGNGNGNGNGGIGMAPPCPAPPPGPSAPAVSPPTTTPGRAPPRIPWRTPSGSAVAAIGFGWACKMQSSSAPEFLWTFLKSCVTGNANSRPPNWIRNGNIPGAFMTEQWHMTTPPSWSIPHFWSKVSLGNMEPIRLVNTFGGTRMKEVPVSTNQFTLVGVFLWMARPPSMTQKDFSPPTFTSGDHDSVLGWHAASALWAPTVM